MKKTKKQKKPKKSAPGPSLSDSSKSLELPPMTKTESAQTKLKASTLSLDNEPPQESTAAVTTVAIPLASSKNHTKSSLMKLFSISNNNNTQTSSTSMNKLANRTSNLFYINDQPKDCDITDTKKMYETWGLKPGYGRNLDSWEIRCGK